MTTIWIGLVHWDNGRWQDSHEKGNKKGKVNGLKITNALAIFGTVVLLTLNLRSSNYVVIMIALC